MLVISSAQLQCECAIDRTTNQAAKGELNRCRLETLQDDLALWRKIGYSIEPKRGYTDKSSIPEIWGKSPPGDADRGQVNLLISRC